MQSSLERIRKNWYTLAVVVLLLLGGLLRLYNLGSYPPKGETADEYAWVFLGGSLIQTGTPTSWSYFPYPEYEHRTIDDMYFPMVSPVLDHPPLFSLIPGIAQTLSGRAWDDPAPFAWLRLPMVLLGVVNMWLFYRFCRTWMRPPAALLSLLLYAVVPSAVLGSRLILADNLLVTILLGYLLLLESKKSERWREIVVTSLAFISPLIKVAALPFSLAYGIIAITEKK